MGECWNCGNEVFLKEEEVRCDRCKKIIRYWCNHCKQPFDVQDRDQIKLNKCKWCYFFKCPNCNVCSESCPKNEHIIFIENQLKKIISIDKYNLITEIANKITDYFEDVKNNREKTICDFGVPKTYAKERIKSILAKMDGFRVRDNDDQLAFEQRQEEILNKELGYEFIVGKEREDGTYGQEYRDVFNLCVCLGKLKYRRKQFTNEKGQEIGYDSWTRIEGGKCPFLDTEELIVKVCPKCKKIFDRTITYCNSCIYPRGGKKHSKGDSVELNEKLSNNPTCKNLSSFKRRGENDGESKFEEND